MSGRRRPVLRRVASFLRCLRTFICIGWTEPGKGGIRRTSHDAHLVRYADDFVILCSQRPEFYLDQAGQF